MVYTIILLILTNLITAITYPIGKISFEYGNPVFLTGLRMVLAGILLIGFELIRGKIHFNITRSFILLLLGLAFFNIFFTNCLQFWALNNTTADKAVFIFNMSPFIAAVFSYFLYQEVMSFKKVIALIISFVGFLPVFFSHQSSAVEHSTNVPFGIPELALLVAATASVIGWFIMKKLLQVTECDLIMANGLSMMLGGVLFFPVSWLFEGPHWWYITNVAALWYYMVILIIVNNIISYNVYAYFIKHISPTLLFLLSFTAPLFALCFSWLLLGEKIGISFIATIIIVAVGLTLYCQEEIRLHKKTVHKG